MNCEDTGGGGIAKTQVGGGANCEDTGGGGIAKTQVGRWGEL